MKKRKKYEFKLQKYHYEAIEMRYRGLTYKEICKELQKTSPRPVKESTIMNWFSRRGMLGKEYLDYAKKENHRRRQVVLEELKKIVLKIPAKYDALLDRVDSKGGEKLDMVTRATLKDLCELLGFKFEPEGSSDPLDDYFDRAEQEIKKEDADKASQ